MPNDYPYPVGYKGADIGVPQLNSEERDMDGARHQVVVLRWHIRGWTCHMV